MPSTVLPSSQTFQSGDDRLASPSPHSDGTQSLTEYCLAHPDACISIGRGRFKQANPPSQRSTVHGSESSQSKSSWQTSATPVRESSAQADVKKTNKVSKLTRDGERYRIWLPRNDLTRCVWVLRLSYCAHTLRLARSLSDLSCIFKGVEAPAITAVIIYVDGECLCPCHPPVR